MTGEIIDATWHVCLIVNNTQELQMSALALASACREAAPSDANVSDGIWTVEQTARYRTADALRQWIDAELPDLTGMPSYDTHGERVGEFRYLAASLMQSAFEDVDWHAVADNVLNTLRES